MLCPYLLCDSSDGSRLCWQPKRSHRLRKQRRRMRRLAACHHPFGPAASPRPFASSSRQSYCYYEKRGDPSSSSRQWRRYRD